MPKPPLSCWFIGLITQIACLAVTMPAIAAKIALRDGAITIEGQIVIGDEKTFNEAAADMRTGLVVLTGPGGSVAAAVAIGQEVRARGLQTLVPPRTACASACALIWLAGTRRLLGMDARIGFHAISVKHLGGTVEETHRFDPELVDYLTALGFALDATATIVNTPAALVRWFDLLELNANGIASRSYP